MIDIETGKLARYWELDALNQGQETKVLNGVTYLPSRDSFLLSGKNFNNIFEVKVDYDK